MCCDYRVLGFGVLGFWDFGILGFWVFGILGSREVRVGSQDFEISGF